MPHPQMPVKRLKRRRPVQRRAFVGILAERQADAAIPVETKLFEAFHHGMALIGHHAMDDGQGDTRLESDAGV